MGMCAVAPRIDAARSGERSLHARTARSAASMTTARAIFMVLARSFVSIYLFLKAEEAAAFASLDECHILWGPAPLPCGSASSC